MKRARRREVDLDAESEPSWGDDEDWIEWGGETILAAGLTSGGAPFGVSVDDWRRGSASCDRGAGWLRAKRVLERIFAPPDGGCLEIGRVRKLGEGGSRSAFVADVELVPDPHGESGTYVVLLPVRDAEPGRDQRMRREFSVLRRLALEALPFRTPKPIALLGTKNVIAVQTFEDGIELDLRAGRMKGVSPWKVVGEIAAATHSVNVSEMDLPGHASRRSHVEAELASFDDLGPDADAARAWVISHMPHDEPAALLHGDLAARNLLWIPEDRPGVLDWEYATRGDAAYDLAVLTRGVRQPFQAGRGVDRLLDAYNAKAQRPLDVAAIRVHELCLAARWYRAALANSSGRVPPDQALSHLRRVLSMALLCS